MTTKRVILLVVGLFFVSASFAQARPQKTEVWCDVSEAYSEAPSGPLDILKVMVKKYPQASRYMVYWSTTDGMAGFSTQVIYDSKLNVLWLERDILMADFQDQSPSSYTQFDTVQRTRFSQVTPYRLAKFFQKYGRKVINNDVAQFVSFFPHLNQFGCKRKIFKEIRQETIQKR
jgi:hypothetical protein